MSRDRTYRHPLLALAVAPPSGFTVAEQSDAGAVLAPPAARLPAIVITVEPLPSGVDLTRYVAAARAGGEAGRLVSEEEAEAAGRPAVTLTWERAGAEAPVTQLESRLVHDGAGVTLAALAADDDDAARLLADLVGSLVLPERWPGGAPEVRTDGLTGWAVVDETAWARALSDPPTAREPLAGWAMVANDPEVELIVERAGARTVGWARGSRALLCGPPTDGGREVAELDRCELPAAVADLLEIARSSTVAARRPERLPVAALASRLASGEEPVLDHWRVEARRPGRRDGRMLEALLRDDGYWLVVPYGADVELRPTDAAELSDHLDELG